MNIYARRVGWYNVSVRYLDNDSNYEGTSFDDACSEWGISSSDIYKYIYTIKDDEYMKRIEQSEIDDMKGTNSQHYDYPVPHGFQINKHVWELIDTTDSNLKLHPKKSYWILVNSINSLFKFDTLNTFSHDFACSYESGKEGKYVLAAYHGGSGGINKALLRGVNNNWDLITVTDSNDAEVEIDWNACAVSETGQYMYAAGEASEGEGDSTITIYVSSGSSSEPYYQFFTDSNGDSNSEITELDISKSYQFQRLSGATDHPFYISEEDSSIVTLTGDGSTSAGITGSQSFTLNFNRTRPENLYYYCSAHSGMIKAFTLVNSVALYKSIDYGSTWSKVKDENNDTNIDDLVNNMSSKCRSIACSSDGQTVVACRSLNKSLEKLPGTVSVTYGSNTFSTTEDLSWLETNSTIQVNGSKYIVNSVTTDTITTIITTKENATETLEGEDIYLYHGLNSAVYISTDGGSSWTQHLHYSDTNINYQRFDNVAVTKDGKTICVTAGKPDNSENGRLWILPDITDNTEFVEKLDTSNNPLLPRNTNFNTGNIEVMNYARNFSIKFDDSKNMYISNISGTIIKISANNDYGDAPTSIDFTTYTDTDNINEGDLDSASLSINSDGSQIAVVKKGLALLSTDNGTNFEVSGDNNNFSNLAIAGNHLFGAFDVFDDVDNKFIPYIAQSTATSGFISRTSTDNVKTISFSSGTTGGTTGAAGAGGATAP